jgi:ferric-dicitrate binding protein FerR (iron transport regulator)
MSARADHERIRSLMSRHLEQDLSEAEQAELEEALSRSDEARRELILLSSLHHELFGLLEGQAAAPTSLSRRRSPQGPPRRMWIPAAVAAGFFIVVALSLLLLNQTRSPREEISRPPERPSQSFEAPKPPGPERARTEAARKQAEQDLESIARNQFRLEKFREQADRENRERERRETEARLALLAAERQAAVEKLEEARAEERKAQEERPKPESSREPTPPATAVFQATLTRVEGDVQVFSGNRRSVPRAGQGLLIDDRLQCGAGAAAVVTFGDGTRLDLGADTTIAGWGDASGKRIFLRMGRLSAEVTKQPPGHPFVIATPHGEVRVVGTALSLHVTSESTELEVQTGKVRLIREKDGAGIEVSGGHLAEIAPGAELAPRSVRVFEFQDGVAPTPRYAGTRSTYLSQNEASKNLAAADVLFSDGDYPEGTHRDREILLKWDLSELPPGVKVRAASLVLHVADGSAHPYPLYPMLREWAETEATWVQSARNRPWQAGGAKGAADRSTTIMGVVSSAEPGFVVSALTGEGVAILQSWIDDPRTNHGVMICNPNTSDAMGITSRRASDLLRRPKLVVTVISKPKR